MDAPTITYKQDIPKELSIVPIVSIVHVKNPTAVSESVEVFDQDIVNLGESSFEAKRITVPLEVCCLLYQWTNARLRSQSPAQTGKAALIGASNFFLYPQLDPDSVPSTP